MNEGEAPDAQTTRGFKMVTASVSEFPRPVANGSRTPDGAVVSFDRRELSQILNVYGRHVAEGEWRDYAIDFTPLKAVFSIYRRASEVPLYRVVKDPSLARRQGAYSIVAATGLILKRGSELGQVLQVLDRKPKFVIV
jgi:hypothetical protein